MKNETLDLIIENYKFQLAELMKFDYLTSVEKNKIDNLIHALTDLVNARVIYERFYESN